MSPVSFALPADLPVGARPAAAPVLGATFSAVLRGAAAAGDALPAAIPTPTPAATAPAEPGEPATLLSLTLQQQASLRGIPAATAGAIPLGVAPARSTAEQPIAPPVPGASAEGAAGQPTLEQLLPSAPGPNPATALAGHEPPTLPAQGGTAEQPSGAMSLPGHEPVVAAPLMQGGALLPSKVGVGERADATADQAAPFPEQVDTDPSASGAEPGRLAATTRTTAGAGTRSRPGSPSREQATSTAATSETVVASSATGKRGGDVQAQAPADHPAILASPVDQRPGTAPKRAVVTEQGSSAAPGAGAPDASPCQPGVTDGKRQPAEAAKRRSGEGDAPTDPGTQASPIPAVSAVPGAAAAPMPVVAQMAPLPPAASPSPTASKPGSADQSRASLVGSPAARAARPPTTTASPSQDAAQRNGRDGEAPSAPFAIAPEIRPAAAVHAIHAATAVLDAALPVATSAKAAEPTPVAAHQLDLAKDGAWLDSLAKDIARTADPNGRLHFSLAPERLGRLDVQLAAGADGTAIRFTTETREAHRIVADAQPQLVAEARAQGLRVSETHVDLGGGGANGASSQSFGAQGFGNQNSGGGGQPPQPRWRPEPGAPAPASAPQDQAGADELYA